MIGPAAGFLAWLGASLVLVSDGRRGVAVGMGIATAGLAVLALLAAGPVAAGALAAGGAVASFRRFQAGAPGWAILPPGSTPRLVLCIAAAIAAFWFAAGVTSGALGSIRFAVVLVIVLAAARVLVSTEHAILLSAAALLALAVGLGAAVAPGAQNPWPFIAGGLAAAAIPWLPLRAPSVA